MDGVIRIGGVAGAFVVRNGAAAGLTGREVLTVLFTSGLFGRTLLCEGVLTILSSTGSLPASCHVTNEHMTSQKLLESTSRAFNIYIVGALIKVHVILLCIK